MSEANTTAATNEVFILGAGFSRAISDRMPLTDELGNLALNRGIFPPETAPFQGGQFEAWLSRRAEPQPYQGAADTLANQALFTRTTEVIAEILDERVAAVLSQPLPVWLGELISIWHLRQSHVVTFNYDPLVECAFETLRLYDWRQNTRFQWGSLINYSPEGKAGASYGEMGNSAAPHPSFRLWKLHGSLNWWWTPGDSTGATVRRVRLPGTFGAAKPLEPDEARWSVPGRERFIVPPAALKSAYYGNPITRGIWQQAFNALKDTDQITLMGYSLPQTDLSTSGMIAEAFTSATSMRLSVVDLEGNGGGIPARLTTLGASATEIDAESCGTDAIPKYVASMTDAAARSAVTKIRSLQASLQSALYVDWGPAGLESSAQGRSAAITEITQKDDRNTFILQTEDLDSLETATRSRASASDDSGQPLTLADLLRESDRMERLLVRVPNSPRDVTIIDAVPRTFDAGYGNGSWIHLVPAGPCPTPR